MQAPLLIQEGWRAERRGGYLGPGDYLWNQKLDVAISTTPAPGATPPQLRRGVVFGTVPSEGSRTGSLQDHPIPASYCQSTVLLKFPHFA